MHLSEVLFQFFRALFNSWVLLRVSRLLSLVVELNTWVALGLVAAADVGALPNIYSSKSIFDAVLPKAILFILWRTQCVKKPSILISVCIKLRHIVLGRLRECCTWDIWHAILINNIGFEWLLVTSLDAIIAHKHYPDVLGLTLAAWDLLARVDLYLLDAVRSWDFGGLLVMETALVHNVIGAIRVLVRVSHFVVDVLTSVRGWGNWHNIGNSNISVWLRHAVNGSDPCEMGRRVTNVIIGQEVSLISCIIHHGICVLIGYGIFCCSHFLFFDKIIVSSCWVLDIRIVPVVSFVFIGLVAYENNVALVDGSLVWAAVRSLLVVGLASADAGSSWSSTVLIKTTNRVAADILGRLSKVEQRWSSWFSSGCNVTSCASRQPYWASFGLTISHKWLVVCIEL